MTKPDKRPAKIYERAALRQNKWPNLYNTTRPPTLAATTTAEVTDQAIGLKPDLLAQELAELYVRAAIAFWMKQAERAEAATKARRTQTVIAAEELQISVEIAEGITNELRRLAGFPPSHPSKQYVSEAAEAR